MNENSNALTDLLTNEELKQYAATAYPFNLSILHNALKLKLKIDPDYEVWLPLVYYKYVPLMKIRNDDPKIIGYKYFISNKGPVASCRGKSPKVLAINIPEEGYPVISLKIGSKRTKTIRVHRALACSFIPVKEDLGGRHPKDLQVNHKNGIKTSYDLDNLEWCTHLENITHGYETGLINSGGTLERHQTVAVKGIVLSGKFKGYEFLLFGGDMRRANGFHASNITSCCTGRLRSHKGCEFRLATEEELTRLPTGLPMEVREALPKTKPRNK